MEGRTRSRERVMMVPSFWREKKMKEVSENLDEKEGSRGDSQG